MMMKRLLGLITLLLAFPLVSYAIWQVSDPNLGMKRRLTKTELGQTDYPLAYINGSRYLFHVRKGLLRDNVKRIAKKYRWRVVWRAPVDYHVLLNTEIVGPAFSVVMDRFLSHYPLQAVYNARYHKMTVSKFGFSKYSHYWSIRNRLK